jgi:hypothetical protein
MLCSGTLNILITASQLSAGSVECTLGLALGGSKETISVLQLRHAPLKFCPGTSGLCGSTESISGTVNTSGLRGSIETVSGPQLWNTPLKILLAPNGDNVRSAVDFGVLSPSRAFGRE